MALTPRLELRHSQSLVMTPQLQQAIKLLQMSNIDLNEFVESELAENPMLERDDSNSPDNHDGSGEAVTETEDSNEDSGSDGPDGLEAIDMNTSDHVTDDQVNALDMENYDNVWDGEPAAEPVSASANEDGGSLSEWSTPVGSGGNTQFENSDYSLEQTISQEISLRDHLLEQIQMDITDPTDRIIAMYLLDMLDEAGRIPDELEDAAERLGCSLNRVEKVLESLQAIDPPGIFARDLAECWAIQLRDLDRFDPAMEALLENIELLKQHEYQALSKICGVDLDDIKDMIDEIWALSHKPAEAFDHIIAQPITPDVIMRSGPSNTWIVELNNDTLPKVLVNNQYYASISKSVRTKDEKQYVTDKLQIANWLVKSLHQRATTILKVATEIVQQQEAFFAKGVEHLKPLVLRDIAEEIEMHESTVSRVTSNKYINTPRGIYELKYFFTTAISSSTGGEAHSAESVRHRIKALIDDELPTKILSDDKLVELLKTSGIDIARRTVAKYREAMKIPSSVQRRREKKRAAGF
ncbi:MAG: RNA polymerase factor sigma-54 [Rhodospirillaceae bacterium]|jgi:RNA polymerase sigma-54 factor|nr:RNA polymerase factor sigma-54 [Rhodospirillaceae bacterium]MBT4589524.1 RNA polymerase factor sigma-54 [Rhodospirillaceae bacterium]MBT5941608.1 RNA polymerase factor sigma-54 [Rhodospirillaceae bacterium]MBT7265657.1 RNA polymerase factor sigma-54 [Rhodospirillaceae bacterium]